VGRSGGLCPNKAEGRVWGTGIATPSGDSTRAPSSKPHSCGGCVLPGTGGGASAGPERRRRLHHPAMKDFPFASTFTGKVDQTATTSGEVRRLRRAGLRQTRRATIAIAPREDPRRRPHRHGDGKIVGVVVGSPTRRRRLSLPRDGPTAQC